MKKILLINLCFILSACTIGMSEQQKKSNQVSCEVAPVGSIPSVDCQPSGGGSRGH